MWESLDPAIRAALIESETKSDASSADAPASKAGQQGRRALTSTGPRMDDTSSKFIGGDSFAKREANPGWIKVRGDVYDAVKGRRDEELSKKVPVDITVTMPDGKTLEGDKVCMCVWDCCILYMMIAVWLPCCQCIIVFCYLQ